MSAPQLTAVDGPPPDQFAAYLRRLRVEAQKMLDAQRAAYLDLRSFVSALDAAIYAAEVDLAYQQAEQRAALEAADD